MPPGPHQDVTFRAIALGALLALAINLACPYSVLVLQNAGLTSDYITAGAMMLFLVLVGLINPALKSLRTGWGLSGVELIVVFVMMVVGCAIPTWGLVTNLFHILTRPFYYATPENGWVDLVHPLIPGWLAPRDPDVARYFYEGLPAGQGIPWSEWAVPMLAWGSAMLAVFLLMVCTMVILRRPWVEQERLVFPLTQLPPRDASRRRRPRGAAHLQEPPSVGRLRLPLHAADAPRSEPLLLLHPPGGDLLRPDPAVPQQRAAALLRQFRDHRPQLLPQSAGRLLGVVLPPPWALPDRHLPRRGLRAPRPARVVDRILSRPVPPGHGGDHRPGGGHPVDGPRSSRARSALGPPLAA